MQTQSGSGTLLWTQLVATASDEQTNRQISIHIPRSFYCLFVCVFVLIPFNSHHLSFPHVLNERHVHNQWRPPRTSSIKDSECEMWSYHVRIVFWQNERLNFHALSTKFGLFLYDSTIVHSNSLLVSLRSVPGEFTFLPKCSLEGRLKQNQGKGFLIIRGSIR